MGKRSSFERRPQDFYRTPYEAVVPLLPYLPAGTAFAEPCAGDGALIDHLTVAGHECVWATDIEPRRDDIDNYDARTIMTACDCYITNPPWRRDVLHEIIMWLSDQKPTWLLLDADWMHTKQAAPYMRRCRQIVSVGRVKWIEDSKHTGKDNCCWYLFEAWPSGQTNFVGRAA
jgi:hypothetical protein